MLTHRQRGRRHALVLLLYALLGLALTYPLITHFATHVPGDGIDDPALSWNLWWLKFSLVDRQINPFISQWMFYPIGINLAFYTLTILNGLLSIPLQVAWALVPASNLVLLSSFVLSGYGAFLLALDVLLPGHQKALHIAHDLRPATRTFRSAPLRDFVQPAFLAGLLYAFSSSKIFYASLGQFNIASSQWIPFAILYVIRSGRPGARLREPLLAALFILLQAYAELTYASFLVIFIAFYALYRLVMMLVVRSRSRSKTGAPSELRSLVRSLVVMGMVVLIGLAPILANMLPDMRAEGDFLVEGGGFADIYSADLAGFALPTQMHPLLGDIIRAASNDSQLRPEGSQWQVNKGQHLTLGWVGLGLALLGLWTRRRHPDAWFWAASALLFFLLALGPSLRIAGHDTGIPGPFRVLQELPFFKGNRYPSRFSVMLLISAAPLVAMGARWLLDRLASRWQAKHDSASINHRATATTALLAALLVFENLSAPLPTSDMHIPAIYDQIAAQSDDADGAVLDLPLGWRNGFSVFGKQDVIIMSEQWWQTQTGKPILGGNTSRNPEQKFRYFLEAPLIGPLTVLANATDANPHIQAQMADGLAALRAGDPGLGGNALLQRAAAEAAQTLRDLNVRFVVVHQDRLPPEFVTFVETYLPVRRVTEEGEHILYQVERPEPPATITVRPATDPLSRGEGWSGPSQPAEADAPAPRWAQRQTTRLLLPSVQPGTHSLTVRAAAAGPGQTLALAVNGYETVAQPLPTAWTELTYGMPDGVLRDAANDVHLRFARTFPVEAILFGLPAAIPAAAPASLLVESASLEAGNIAHIWLNGVDISPNQRGYNLAIVDTRTWQPSAVAAFDTHLDPAASQAMVEFLSQMDQHSALAVAVKDTAGDQLSAEAAQELVALGLSDLRGRFRWGQAAIVLPPDPTSGQRPVIEQISGLEPVQAVIGPGLREPQVAGAVEWVRVEP